MKKLIIIPVTIILSVFYTSAQELICNIQVVSQQVQGTNKQVYRTMQQALQEFMNNRNWTNHVYSHEERIECNILINITKQVGADEFQGTMQIQSRRPVYNSSYSTVIMNYMDNDIYFKYVEFESLDFNETTHTSNLTSLLAFYAYFILGMDYDSFSYEGGTPFFRKAEQIVANAQNAPEKGWKSYDSKEHKNRYWLVQSILEEEFSPIREFMYRYHRLGLDVMDSKPADGRSQIVESIEKLQEVSRKKPDPFMHLLTVILLAKTDEFVNIFEEGSVDEKVRCQKMLNEIDPSNRSKYEAITKED